MKANLSLGECIARILISVFFAAFCAGMLPGPIGLIGLLAIYPFVTGLGGWDPIYAAWGKFSNEDDPYLEKTQANPAGGNAKGSEQGATAA